MVFNLEVEGNSNYFAEDVLVHNCHHLGPMEQPSQYYDLIEAQTAMNPDLRVLGVTATPFRLGHGYIYGDGCRKGRTNFFPTLDWKATLDDLTPEYLSPWRGKAPADIGDCLAKVGKSLGEYEIGALSEEMCRGVHVETAVKAYEKYGEGRRKVLVFGVSIKHAELLAETFRASGHRAAAVHSEMEREARRAVLAGFDSGALDVLVNVGVLTEGWDSPAVDLIIMCRPTMSPGLYVQMIGRGTRKSPGKENLLFLDLVNNWKAHGDPSRPRVAFMESEPDGEAPMKECGNPECMALVPLGTKVCPECGFVFVADEPEREAEVPELVEVSREDPAEIERKAREGAMLPVSDWLIMTHRTRRGHLMARLETYFRGRQSPVCTYLDFEGQASDWGRRKARKMWRWMSRVGGPPPETVADAVKRADEIAVPGELTVFRDGNGYEGIKEWR